MDMNHPVRLQLSRRKGFKLQAASRAVNGLDAVKVDRSTMWGNPWKPGTWSNTLGRHVESVEEAVDLYRRNAWVEPHMVAWVQENLRGKNLACWCALEAKHCHADVLLKLANIDPAEPA